MAWCSMHPQLFAQSVFSNMHILPMPILLSWTFQQSGLFAMLDTSFGQNPVLNVRLFTSLHSQNHMHAGENSSGAAAHFSP